MKIIFVHTKKQKAMVKVVGKTLSLLMLFVAISKCLAERILKEKETGVKEAEDIVIDCIKDGMKTIKE